MNPNIINYISNSKIEETERLILRPIKKDDFKDLHEILSDKHNFQYNSSGHYFNEQETQQALNYYTDFELVKSRNEINIAITLKSNNKLIGIMVLSGRFNMPICDLSCMLNSRFQNQGYATEAVLKVVKIAFNDLHLYRVSAELAIDNKASVKLLEKTGFTLEGIKRNDYFQDGEFYNVGCYGILKQD